MSENTGRPSPIVALWRSSHPGPSVVVTFVAVTLGIASGLEPWRIAVLGLAILFGQLSVGISNDAIDAPRDTRDRPHRQADRARRCVAASRAGWRHPALVVVSLALSFLLSWAMGLAHLIALASAWSYNAVLKSTPFSVLPFIVSFGLLPSLVTLSAGSAEPGCGVGVGRRRGAGHRDPPHERAARPRGRRADRGARPAAPARTPRVGRDRRCGARGRRRRGAARTGERHHRVRRDRLRGSRRDRRGSDSCWRSCAHRGAGSSGS